jgi:enamine deaminase RidA (YjgF/YER057c/UK114 family)
MAAGAKAQLKDMLENAKTFAENIQDAKKRYTKEEFVVRDGGTFTAELINKIHDDVLASTQQFF